MIISIRRSHRTDSPSSRNRARHERFARSPLLPLELTDHIGPLVCIERRGEHALSMARPTLLACTGEKANRTSHRRSAVSPFLWNLADFLHRGEPRLLHVRTGDLLPREEREFGSAASTRCHRPFSRCQLRQDPLLRVLLRLHPIFLGRRHAFSSVSNLVPRGTKFAPSCPQVGGQVGAKSGPSPGGQVGAKSKSRAPG